MTPWAAAHQPAYAAVAARLRLKRLQLCSLRPRDERSGPDTCPGLAPHDASATRPARCARREAEAKREEEEQVIQRVLNQTEAIATRLDETSARGAASMRRARAYRATLRRRLRSAVESERSQV